MLSYRLLVVGPVIVFRDTFACRPRFYAVTLPLCAPRTLVLPVGTRLNSILYILFLFTVALGQLLLTFRLLIAPSRFYFSWLVFSRFLH